MDQTTLGIGTRLQHTQHGPGVIVGIKYATYLISFINAGIKEIDKTDDKRGSGRGRGSGHDLQAWPHIAGG